MDAHEELVFAYLELHPKASWAEAYDATADLAYDHMREKLFDAADNLRKREREEG